MTDTPTKGAIMEWDNADALRAIASLYGDDDPEVLQRTRVPPPARRCRRSRGIGTIGPRPGADRAWPGPVSIRMLTGQAGFRVSSRPDHRTTDQEWR
ncbi:hypothetical protein [Pseudonocardia sp. 73-21]|uniref:hypothetical protein n=1 Tax=Pseudonocardia sp. 73-21 TaxID=1895809 RepID=UPI00096286AD|nr:hypothetical protein [Pseudonocardia sp. 73-21]OJY53951.1 MAG: hypothetical protein BGP03_19490 [Pseudonocardia sp. 73-21]